MARCISVIIICVATLHSPSLCAQEDRGDVTIHSDARLAVLLRKSHSYAQLNMPESIKPTVEPVAKPPMSSVTGVAGPVHREHKTIYTGRGFRVQIYNGPDREKALAMKKEFMRKFPGVSTYIMYMAPGFRVKIGDYRLRGDAESMLREANSMYSPSMIVPDMVTVSTY